MHRDRFIGKICCAMLLVVALIGCQDNSNRTVPPHLIGVWTTSTPKYADRFLQFTEHHLIFGIGTGQEISHSIDKVDSTQANGRDIVYTFHYKDAEGEKWTLTVTYYMDTKILKLQYRDDIWELTRSR
jgi:hypothetical protein